MIATSQVCVGVDIGSKTAKAVLMDADGTVLQRLALSNDLPGAERLAQRLGDVVAERAVSQVLIGLEATSHYHWHLSLYLQTHERLTPLVQVFALNPRLARGFKRAYADLPKNDWTDAWVIADRLRFGRLPAPFRVEERYEPLRRLTRFRTHLAHALAREKNYFLSVLFVRFAAFVQHDVMADPFGAAAGALLTEAWSVEEVAHMPLTDLAAFLAQRSRNHFREPDAMAQEIQRIARLSFKPPVFLEEPLRFILATSLQTIRALEGAIAQVDRAIAQVFQAVPQTLTSVPGLGGVCAAGLVAELGDIAKWTDDAAVAKAAGLVWRQLQSEEFEAEDTPLRKTGNPYLRYYLVEAANSLRATNSTGQKGGLPQLGLPT